MQKSQLVRRNADQFLLVSCTFRQRLTTTIVTFTDKKGNVLASSSAGATGFRGSKKGTAYAAQVAAEKAAETVKGLHGVNAVDVYVKGVGLGRDAAIRAMTNFDIAVDSIKDVTGVPHGGVRPRKARRA